MAVSRSDEVQPLRAAAAFLVGSLQSSYHWIPSLVLPDDSPEELREKNIMLSAELARLRRAKSENDELRKLLSLPKRENWKLAAADIVGKTFTGDRNMLTLNIGADQGVRRGMAVMTADGLVGKVFAVSGGYCTVEGLYNRTMRIAVKIARTRVDGIMLWDGTNVLLVKNIPKALDVQKGDMVVTSEYSTFFAPDIPIGIVSRLEPEPNTLFWRIYVEPYSHPSLIDHVYVVIEDESKQREKFDLESKALSPMKKDKR